MAARRSIEYLREMSRTGENEYLLEACKALGFEVESCHSTSVVKWNTAIVATVVGDRLTLNDEIPTGLEVTMPVVTPEQGTAFDCAISRLERDKIAVHEAGHVVVAWAHGLKICFVRLGEKSEVQFCDDHALNTLDYCDSGTVEDMQEVWAAGAAAERVVFGEFRPHGPSDDQITVNTMERQKLQATTGNSPVAVDVFLDYVARAHSHMTKERVLAVACELNRKSFLSRQEIEEVLKTVGVGAD